MSNTPPFRPKPRTIAFLIFDQFQILDAAGPISAFDIAERFAPGSYRLRFLSAAGGLVASSAGVAFSTEAMSRAPLTHINTLIAAGGMGTKAAAQDAKLLAYLRRAHMRVRRLASVCSGSFLLAAAGLLDGKSATTHWRQAPLMQRLFPDVNVEPDRIHVEDSGIWTSAGVTAGIDLSLAMIAEDLGPEIAKEVAREMVVYARRPGGQTQHSTLVELDTPGGRFASLHAWIRAHLAEELPVERLAVQAAMSTRNFTRAYTKETGIPPAKAVERIRLEAARAALESGAASIQDVARKTGFGDSERMRRAFVRTFGTPPALLRRTLRHA